MHEKEICDAVAAVDRLTLEEIRHLVDRTAAPDAAHDDASLQQQVQSCIRFAATVSLAVEAFNEQLHANKPFEEALKLACEEYGIGQYCDRVWSVWKLRCGPILGP